MISATDPQAVKLGFPDRSRYFDQKIKMCKVKFYLLFRKGVTLGHFLELEEDSLKTSVEGNAQH
jgi:hypothetical protein